MMVAPDFETVVTATGERAMVCLQCSKTDAIDELRYRKCKKKVVSQKRVALPQSLPPTGSATKFHSLSPPYHQIHISQMPLKKTQQPLIGKVSADISIPSIPTFPRHQLIFWRSSSSLSMQNKLFDLMVQLQTWALLLTDVGMPG